MHLNLISDCNCVLQCQVSFLLCYLQIMGIIHKTEGKGHLCFLRFIGITISFFYHTRFQCSKAAFRFSLVVVADFMPYLLSSFSYHTCNIHSLSISSYLPTSIPLEHVLCGIKGCYISLIGSVKQTVISGLCYWDKIHILLICIR